MNPGGNQEKSIQRNHNVTQSSLLFCCYLEKNYTQNKYNKFDYPKYLQNISKLKKFTEFISEAMSRQLFSK